MTRNYSRNQSIPATVLLVSIMAAALLLAPWPYAKQALSDDTLLYAASNNQTDKIHVTSNRLETDNEASFAEFSGDVIVTQGTTVINSDMLRVYYKGSGDKQATSGSGSGMIDRIVASGNVRIQMDDRQAESDRAEYVTETGLITLTGKNAKVSSGNNSIAGHKITIHRQTNKMTVERKGDTRVEAVIYSGNQLMN